MMDQVEFKDKLKMQIGMFFLYYITEFFIFFLLFEFAISDWKTGVINDIVITVVGFLLVIMLSLIKSCRDKRGLSNFMMGESIVFSLNQLYFILKFHYNQYGKWSMGIIGIYVVFAIVLFIVIKDFYKRMFVKQEIEKEKNTKFKVGVISIAALFGMGISRIGKSNSEVSNWFGILMSLIFSLAWLALAWFLFQGRKVYLDNSQCNVKTEKL